VLDRRSANTFDVHRVLHHAQAEGRGSQFFTTAQDRFFAGDLNPFDREQLLTVTQEVGLDRAGVDTVLAGDDYAAAVRADRAEGSALGITGVPFVVIDRRLAAAGAQTVEAYGAALDQAITTSVRARS
jgi:predicted DsbA family dithiol-disulfide isomerase